MKNYAKTSIGNEGRVELHEALDLTGAEISTNRRPAGRTPPDDLKQIKAWEKQSVISVAGGINGSTVDICMEAGADILIVGGGISRAEYPETAAGNISAKVHR